MNPENREPESNETEREQTPEEILAVISGALAAIAEDKEGRERIGVLLTQKVKDGKLVTNPAVPISLEGDRLEIDAGGWGFSIDVSQIVRAELIKEKISEE